MKKSTKKTTRKPAKKSKPAAKKKTVKKGKTQPSTAVAINRASLIALAEQNSLIADQLVRFAVNLRDTATDLLRASKEGL